LASGTGRGIQLSDLFKGIQLLNTFSPSQRHTNIPRVDISIVSVLLQSCGKLSIEKHLLELKLKEIE